MRILLTILFSASLCQGAIVVSGDIINSGGTFEITQDITIAVTSSGNWGALVFDDWVTHDGSQNGVGITPDSITYSINGGSSSTANTISLVDNTAGLGDLSSGDGFFGIGAGGIPVSNGDTLTVVSGTYSTGANSSWNPAAIQTFTGEVFLVDTSWNRISGDVSVPEPSTGSLAFAACASGLLLTRSRRKA